VSASVNLPLHHKVQKFSSGTGSPRWSRKKGRKMVVCVCVWHLMPSECRFANSTAANLNIFAPMAQQDAEDSPKTVVVD